MADGNELELSLGLSFGGSSSKSKGKDVDSGPVTVEETAKNLSGSDSSFKNFFEAVVGSQGHNGQITDSRPQENFWTDLGKTSATTVDVLVPDTEQNSQTAFIKYKLRSANKRTNEAADESSNKKRCFPSDEIRQGRDENVVDHAEVVGKDDNGATSVKSSHISVTPEDGSTGKNEVVAESVTEGQDSLLVSQREEKVEPSDASKITDKQAINDPSVIGIQEKKQQNTGKEFNSEPGKVTFGTSSSLQSLPVVNVSRPVSAMVVTATDAACAATRMQLMPGSNSEEVQEMNPNSIKIAFGYSSYQLPTLETNSSWAFGSHFRRSSSSSESVQGPQYAEDDLKRSHGTVGALPSVLAFQGKSPDLEKASGTQIAEIGMISSNGAENTGTSSIFKPKEAATRPPVIEKFAPEGCFIRPGIVPDVKFGGCGSYPNLPWVSTAGSGPKGRTISGVTYKHGQNQIKIVCACHGTHMLPEEFIQHANSDATNPEYNTNYASPGNPTAPMLN